MPKKIYMYSSTKKDLLDWYKYLFKKKDLHSHFFFNRDYQNETKKELILASFTVLADIIENIAKNDYFEVKSITKPGIEVHGINQLQAI